MSLNLRSDEKDKRKPGRPVDAPDSGEPLPDPFTPLDPSKRKPYKPVIPPTIPPIPPIPST